MLKAMIVTTANIDQITELNSGVRPAPETLNVDTFFVYDEQGGRFPELMSRRQFESRYRWTHLQDNYNGVEEI